jgi:hypothetical protein
MFVLHVCVRVCPMTVRQSAERAHLLLFRQMLASAEPSLSLAVSLMRDVREYGLANVMFYQLTNAELGRQRNDDDHQLIALCRLKHASAKYPLLQLRLTAEDLSPQFFEALAATTTLTSLAVTSEMREDTAARLALQLKAMPTVRAADFSQFSIDAAVKLLQSRTNWTHIELSFNATDMLDASTCALLNQSDFELSLRQPAAAGLDPWLFNPHLTALNVECVVLPDRSFDVLQQCKNLFFMVCIVRCSCVWF